MDFLCSVCEGHIPQNFVNRTKGLAYCGTCQNYLYLTGFLKREPSQIREETAYLGLRKPQNCMIEVAIQGDSHSITIPGDNQLRKWRTIGTTVFVLICWWGFLAFWAYKRIVVQQEGSTVDVAIIVGFVLAGFVMLMSLMSDYYDTILFFTKNSISASQKKILGYTSVRKRKMRDLLTARGFFESDSEGGTSYGVRLHFVEDYNLEIADNIKEEKEREWLAGQIIHIRNQLMMDEAVRTDVDMKLAKAYQNPPLERILQVKDAPMKLRRIAERTTLELPKERWKGETLLQLGATVIGVILFSGLTLHMWGYFGQTKVLFYGEYIFLLLLLVLIYALVALLFSLFYRTKTQVEINEKTISVHRTPFGIPFKTERPISGWTSIEKDKTGKYVLLHFSEGQPIRLGFLLEDKELRWLIGELKWVWEGLN